MILDLLNLISFDTKNFNLYKWIRVCLLCLCFIATTTTMNGQVDITATGGTLTASYATLKACFDQINAGTHTGVISIAITNNTTETLSAVLNASGAGSASYTGIAISPSGGSYSITGSIAGHLVDLNGADNIIIDGLNSGGNALTINNSDGGFSTSTIRFTNDASNNKIARCTILGAAGATIGTGFGVVYFATGTTTGNDLDTLESNTISNSGANFPINAIYSLGTSSAIDNANIAILNNNINNFYNANAVTNAINANTGSSNWLISGNSFYQTATRNYTNTNTHNIINILAGQGYTISGNFIGGTAPSCGGTPYNITGTIATRLIGINMSPTLTAVTNSVQGNTISNFTMATSSGALTTNGVFCGINLLGAGVNYNVGTVTGNVVGSTTGVNNIVLTSTTNQALLTAIHSGATGNVSIQNNQFGALTSSGSTAAVAGAVYIVNVSGAASNLTISNNKFGNTTANNIRAGTNGLTTGGSLLSGVFFAATPTIVNITNDSFRNFASYGANTATNVRGMTTQATTGSTALFTVTGNVVHDLTTDSRLTTISNGQASAVGLNIAIGTNNIISQNVIYNISNTSTASTASYVAGISLANATNSAISRNRIYSLTNSGTSVTSTAPSAIVGILVRSGTTGVTVVNNMISLGIGVSNNNAIIGINGNHGSAPNPTVDVFHNSINIEGTVTSGAQPSFGFYRGDFSTTARTATTNIKNNIIVNNRSGGTGPHCAIANNYNATTPSATGWSANASNNNILNAASSSSIGYWTTAQNFSGWKTVSNSDANSFSGASLAFINIADADLHLNTATATQAERGGTSLATVTIDYDGNARNATYPDIGADEDNFTMIDQVPPTILHNPILSNCNSSQTLTVSMSDASGMPTAGAELPVLYWRINAGAWAGATGTLLTSSTYTNTYSFSFGSGAVPGDVISYYTAAQDVYSTPNVTCLPSIGAAGFSSSPPAVSTPPTTPFTYNFNATSLGGTYTVGAGGAYTTLTDAINAYNTSCLSSHVIFELTDATYTSPAETFPITIGPNGDASASKTLTIRPAAGISPTITGVLASNALIKIKGSYIKIDGSNGGSTSRDLTITNTSTTAPQVIRLGNNYIVPTPTIADTVMNCIVTNGVSSSSAFVISDSAGAAGYFNNIGVLNNDFRTAYIGMYAIAVPLTGNGSGLRVSNNLFNNITNQIRLVAAYLQGIDGGIVSGNTIGNITNANAEVVNPIWLASGTTNTTVSNNNITSISTTNTGAAGINGINVTGGTGNIIDGNIITSLTNAGTGQLSGINSSGQASTISNNNINTLTKNTSVTGNFAGIITFSPSTNITNNTVSTLTQNVSAAVWGIITSGNINANISGNTVSNMSTSTTSTGAVLGINPQGATTGINVFNNKVSNIKQSNSTTGVASVGIQLASTSTTSNIKLYNNFVYDIASFGSATPTSSGVGINLASGGGYDVDHNTVRMNAAHSFTGSKSAALIVSASGTNNIRNNILVNDQGGSPANRYAVFSNSSNTVFGTINNNNYYSTDVTPSLGEIGGIVQTTIAEMQTGFGGNANSKTVVPTFYSATNLHLDSMTNYYLESAGLPIVGITQDIDSQTRSVATPDIGADEFRATCDAAAFATLAPSGTTAIIKQCDADPTGWVYYSPSSNPNQLMFGIKKGTSTLTGESISLLVSATPHSTTMQTSGSGYRHQAFFMPRDWNVTAATHTGPVDIRFYYDAADTSAAKTERDNALSALTGSPTSIASSLKWFKTDGVPYDATWRGTVVGNQFPTSHVNLSPTYGTQNGVSYVEFTGITSFSGGTGGYAFGAPGSGGGVALPVTWAGFDASALELGNELVWKTSSEVNALHFEVEYSYDGKNFMNSGVRIAAAGNSQVLNTYGYTHPDFNAIVYYRIKEVDRDKRTNYSATKMVKRLLGPSFQVAVYPIPVKEDNLLNVQVKNVDRSEMNIRIIDMNGRVLNQTMVIPSKDFVQESINVSGLSGGIYQLEVQNGQGREVIKFTR